jgi:antitoxin FitA
VADVLIRNVPDGVLAALKRRAEVNHRSLQGELLTILEDASARRLSPEQHARLADEIRERLARTGRDFGDSAVDQREGRER